MSLTQKQIELLKSQGLTDEEIAQIANGGEVTKQPTPPSSPSPVSSLASLGAGYLTSDLLEGGSAVIPPTPELISATAVPGGSVAAPATILGSETAATYLPPAAAILGAYEAYKGYQNRSPVQGALGGAASGAGVGFMVGGPLGAGIGAGVGGLAGLGGSYLNHKSTKEYEQEGTNAALNKAPDDAAWKDFVMQARAAAHGDLYPDAPGDHRIPDKNDEVTADSRMFSLGNLQTFGKDWMDKYSIEQKRNISQALLDNNLYSSSKGDVHVTDPEFALQLAKQVMDGTYKYKAGAPPEDHSPTFNNATNAKASDTPPSDTPDAAALDFEPIAREIEKQQLQTQAKQAAKNKKDTLIGIGNSLTNNLSPATRKFDVSTLLKNRYY